jgi:hypothetical protein
VSELVVVGGTVAAAFVARPLIEFAWSFLWAPWRAMREDVEALKGQRSKPVRRVDVPLSMSEFIREGALIATRTIPHAHWSIETDKAELWTQKVVRFLAEHCSNEAARQFSAVAENEGIQARVECLRELSASHATETSRAAG